MPFTDFQLLLLILRGALGLLGGILYGLLVYVVVYALTHIGLDYEHPGPLIPNNVEWANLATVIAAWIAGISAAVVGLIVGLVATRRKTAAIIGFIGGLILLGLLYVPLPQERVGSSLRYILGLLELVLFPFGLALTSMLVASISIRLKRWGM